MVHWQRVKNIIVTGTMIAAIASVLLFIFNGLLIRHQSNKLIQQAEKLLQQGDIITGQIVLALNDAERLAAEPCSPAYIAGLKEIRWRYTYIDDVAYQRNNHLICSAFWGMFSPPLNIDAVSNTQDDHYKLLNVEEHNQIRYSSRAVMQGQSAVFISRSANENLLKTVSDGYFLLASPDAAHEYLKSIDKGYISPDKNLYHRLFMVEVRVCDEKWHLCVTAQNARAGFLALSGGLLSFIVAVACILSTFLSLFMLDALRKRNSLVARLRKAIANKHLFIEYQPIVSAADAQIAGVEALVRWRDRNYGYVSPDVFIRAAEDNGLYPALSAFVISNAIEEMSGLLREQRALTLSLNITDYEIGAADFVENLVRLCERQQLEPGQIKLEISEQCQLPLKVIKAFAEKVAQASLKLAIDDFGVANSNITWLTDLQFDEVKFDRSLVHNIDNINKEKILFSLGSIITGMGKRIVFEGIENDAMLTIACKVDPQCLVQGWLFYRSMSFKDVETLIKGTVCQKNK